MAKLKKGDRVALHAATDEWMRGDRFGTVVGFGRKREYVDRSTREVASVAPALVKLDKSGRTVRMHPDNLFLENSPRAIRRNPGDEKGFNGWANWETWNVALWISNDEGLYAMAKQYRNRSRGNYKAFVEELREAAEEGTAIAYETPDGAAWNDSGLDTDALDEMIQEL